MKTNIELLEEQFANLCHVIGNKNLNIILRHDKSDMPFDKKTVADSVKIAEAMRDFKEAFVNFRENGYQ